MPRVRRGVIYSFLIVSSLVVSAIRSLADNGWEDRILSLTWENDATYGTDRHYTQGARISYYSSDDALPKWLRRLSDGLPAIGLEVQARKFGLALGQEIYTPEDLQIASAITSDRPYAGWLYTRLGLQRRGEVSPAWLAKEELSLDFGIIGPESGAREVQYVAHLERPQGWRHQLKTELAFDLRYDRRYLYRIGDREEGWGIDVIPSFTGVGGTVATFLGLGTTLRFGYRIPNEFEAPKQPTPLDYGAYLFTSAEGRYVIRNIFLDGNTFTASQRVDKKPLVADVRIGVTFVLKRVELTAAQTLRTREFNGQKSYDSFGTAMATFKF